MRLDAFLFSVCVTVVWPRRSISRREKEIKEIVASDADKSDARSSSCATASGGLGTTIRKNELAVTGIHQLSFQPHSCSVTKSQPFSGVHVESLKSSAEARIVIDAGRKKSADPAIAFKQRLKPENILGVGVGNGTDGEPTALNFAVSGRLAFRLQGDSSVEYVFDNFRVGQSSQWISFKAKSIKMNNWWLASDACKYYSQPLGLRCESKSGAPVCIELKIGPNRFHATECTYTKANAAPVILNLLKEAPACRKDGVCVSMFDSDGDKLDLHEKLDIHPAENALYGLIWNQVVQKNAELMKEILQGGHVVLENDMLTMRDGKPVYDFLKTLPDAFERTSSHSSDVAQFGLPQGRIMKHLLFGRVGEKTWFQFENSPWSLFKDPLGSLHHAYDWVQYQATGKNQGPLGESEHTDSNPMRVQELASLEHACPSMCTTVARVSTTTTTTRTGHVHSVGPFYHDQGDAVMWWVCCGTIGGVLVFAIALYCICVRNRNPQQTSSWTVID